MHAKCLAHTPVQHKPLVNSNLQPNSLQGGKKKKYSLNQLYLVKSGKFIQHQKHDDLWVDETLWVSYFQLEETSAER